MSADYIFADAAEPIFGIQQGMSLLRVHDPAKCAGDACCIHNPSDHHMRTWPQNWRGDKAMMERLCPHGVGHPDPDDLAVRTTRWAGVHGCDGCCRRPS
jgi:hypothetical protein